MAEHKKKNKTKILHLSFNKDKTCLALGMQTGYRIYDLSKKGTETLLYYERILGKGIGIIEMLEKTSILALVGGGNDPYGPSNKIHIYDDQKGTVVANMTFKSNVLNIRLKKDKILVICESFIYFINFENFKPIDSMDLGEEKKKKIAFAFTLEPEVNKLAYNINNINNNKENKIIINSYEGDNKKTSIKLNTNFNTNNLIRCIEFNKKGNLLAITAKYCNHIEIYNSETGLIVGKCNLEPENINTKYLSFSFESDFICCFLENGEVNIFNIKSVSNILEEDDENFNLIKNENEIKEIKLWTKFYLPEKNVICTFANFMENEQGKDFIICIGNKGNYYLVKFDKDKSEDLALKVCDKYFLKNDTEMRYNANI